LLAPTHPLRPLAQQLLTRCEAVEALARARDCQQGKQLHAAAVHHYADAFAAEPRLAADLQAHHRYNAACSAVLTGCGQGKDAGSLDGKERARLRQQALDWLRADLGALRQRLDRGEPEDQAAVGSEFPKWQQDPDLAGVRDEKALSVLPADERNAWEKLWAEVAALIEKSRPR
jgi:serine/threonine-protein kinase